MRDISKMPDDLLEMISGREPQIPICGPECQIWCLEHEDCQGCKHWAMCGSFILGLEIGARRYAYGDVTTLRRWLSELANSTEWITLLIEALKQSKKPEGEEN